MPFKTIASGALALCAVLLATDARAQAQEILPSSLDEGYTAVAPYWVRFPVIEIIGRAALEFPPNKATVRVQLEAMDADADRAQMLVSDRARAAIARIEALAGGKARISANSIREEIFEQYRTRDGTRVENERSDKVELYVMRWVITVELDDPALVPAVRAELLAAGNARELGSVGFDFEPTAEQTRMVFEAAVQDATARAAIASRAAGGARLRLLVMQEGRSECMSEATGGFGIQEVVPAPMAVTEPPLQDTQPQPAPARQLTAQNVVLPSSPTPTRLEASVCMVYAIERPGRN